jgi:glycosyltransferase involved in cell wall biosynthesis
MTMADAYAACDAVTLPSTWEGFGNPALESAVYHRPLGIGPYPVAAELAAFGFRWFALDQAADLRAFLDHPDRGLLADNHEVARRFFSTADLPGRLERLLGTGPAPNWSSSGTRRGAGGRLR